MSRHTIRDDSDYEVVVGWDRPLATFFVQVYDRRAFEEALRKDPDADEVLALWRGGLPYDLPAVSDIAAALGGYATITGEMSEQLQADREESLGA